MIPVREDVLDILSQSCVYPRKVKLENLIHVRSSPPQRVELHTGLDSTPGSDSLKINRKQNTIDCEKLLHSRVVGGGSAPGFWCVILLDIIPTNLHIKHQT